MGAPSAIPALIFSFVSWVLFLVATASTPVTKSVSFVRLTTADGGFTLAKSGAFGVCYPGGSYQYLNMTLSIARHCTSQSVGYKLDKSVLGDVADHVTNPLSDGLSHALILNALCCISAGAAFLFIFIACAYSNFWGGYLGDWGLYIAHIVGWAAWAVDLAMPLVARHRIKSSPMASLYFKSHIGNGVWITLAGILVNMLAEAALRIGPWETTTRNYGDGPRYTS